MKPVAQIGGSKVNKPLHGGKGMKRGVSTVASAINKQGKVNKINGIIGGIAN